jgi:hypothetical protein
LLAVAAAVWGGTSEARQDRALFQTSDNCLACHNGLTSSSGEDVSIGSDWRASIMANSSRDPYWQAAVRREMTDHPSAAGAIEDECAVCHMPMARTQARANNRAGRVFAHLPVARTTRDEDRLAHDGVSCTICHQIASDKLGTPESFTGGYVVSTVRSDKPRPTYGLHEVDKGRTRIMQSATGMFAPTESTHIRESELCATCHTLYTEALGADGTPIGRLPEQMPYLEWRHSSYRTTRSCQACHMPRLEEETRIASVLGQPRSGLSRHGFRGGNFFMLRMLNKYRTELGVEALPQELEAAANRTLQQLQQDTARISIERAAASGSQLDVVVMVENLTGHKLPTGYPSRRIWLHLTVRDREGRAIFESGAAGPDGSIQGNDNDADAGRFEPHQQEIRRPDQVQIYESVMVDVEGRVTTGLLQGVRYAKDNRLLPRGFDKTTADGDIAVVGPAADDEDFSGGVDRVRYAIPASGDGPFEVNVELRYQPISFRWARNLAAYQAPEPRRFVTYYDSMSGASSEVLARARASAR